MFVLKKVGKIFIAVLHCLTQGMQHATSAGADLSIIFHKHNFTSMCC